MGVEQGCNQVFSDLLAHFKVVGASVRGLGKGKARELDREGCERARGRLLAIEVGQDVGGNDCF